MVEAKYPVRIWATVNGASTRLPDGGRQLIGGWSEDDQRPGCREYVRADIADVMLAALRRIDVGKEVRDPHDPSTTIMVALDGDEIDAICAAAIAEAEGRL